MFPAQTQEAFDRLQELIRTHPERRWQVDKHYRYTDLAQSLLCLLGRERGDVLGKYIFDFMTPEEAARVSRLFHSKPGQPYSGAISHHVRPDGNTVAIESYAVPLQDDDGQLAGYYGIAHAVAHFDPAESESVYRMKAIYDTAPAALCLVGRDGRYLAANTAYASIYGLSSEALVGRKVEEFQPGAGDLIRKDLKCLDAGVDVPAHEVSHRGNVYQMLVKPLRNLMGQVTGITTALMDITERKRAEQELAETNRRLEHYARHDYLTGLANRRHVDEVLVDEVGRAVRERHPLSVLMVDVDFFKRYNDHYGHLLGDECLRTIAVQLKSVLHRHGDLVGRYGGEEFVAILPGTDAAGALKIAEAVREGTADLNMPHKESEHGKVTLSIGVATLDPCTSAWEILADAEALLYVADQALYAAKLAGRNTVFSHSPEGELFDA
jgi:diguanylate cyclase (GGDEF)-like protein/PAS domain S-box-containing protein